MTRWWEAEGREMFGESEGGLRILDMAAGRSVSSDLQILTGNGSTDTTSGEATICLLEWEAAGKAPTAPTEGERSSGISTPTSSSSAGPSTSRAFIPPNARRSAQNRTLFASTPPTLPTTFHLDIVATDPVSLPSDLTRRSSKS